MLSEKPKIILVHATIQNAFYSDLARRLLLACRQIGIATDLISSDAIHKVPSWVAREASLVLVNPYDLVHNLPNREPFYEAISGFRSRIMVLAEAVETSWFSNQLELPVAIDTFVDVGFLPQEDKIKELGLPRLPYRFLFHGLSKRERERVATENPKENAKRPIPWAFVGHKTIERVEFVRWLVEEVEARGVVFLPDKGHGVRPGSGAISPTGMDLLLKKSRTYVWVAHHEFAYYESFRFREAVLNGAVPLKLDRRFSHMHSSVPGVVSNQVELALFFSKERYEQAYEESRAYLLHREGFEEGVRRILLDEL